MITESLLYLFSQFNSLNASTTLIRTPSMAFSVSVLMGIQLTLLVTKCYCLFAEVERVTSPGAGFCQC